MVNELRILDLTGDTKLIWDSADEAETENARRTFNDLKKKGHVAFKVKKSGQPGKRIDEFDPEAGKIIMAPMLRGG